MSSWNQEAYYKCHFAVVRGIFAPIFAPFPAIVYTPRETFYVPIHTPSQNIPGRRLELRGSSGSNTSTTTQRLGFSGDPG